MQALKLQLAVEAVIGKLSPDGMLLHEGEQEKYRPEDLKNVTIYDVCLSPLAPLNRNCSVQSVFAYFQDSIDKLNMTDGIDPFSYLHHFDNCSKYVLFLVNINPDCFASSVAILADLVLEFARSSELLACLVVNVLFYIISLGADFMCKSSYGTLAH